MTKPNKDTGKSKMEVAYEIRELTGVVTSEMKAAPDYPWDTRYIWEWFIDLSRGRSIGAMAVNAISWADMYAYFSLIGIKPMRWEVDAVRALDTIFLEARSTDEQVVATAKGLPQMKDTNNA